MTGTTNEPLVGASVWEREFFAHLRQHVRNERNVLEAYVAA